MTNVGNCFQMSSNLCMHTLTPFFAIASVMSTYLNKASDTPKQTMSIYQSLLCRNYFASNLHIKSILCWITGFPLKRSYHKVNTRVLNPDILLLWKGSTHLVHLRSWSYKINPLTAFSSPKIGLPSLEFCIFKYKKAIFLWCLDITTKCLNKMCLCILLFFTKEDPFRDWRGNVCHLWASASLSICKCKHCPRVWDHCVERKAWCFDKATQRGAACSKTHQMNSVFRHKRVTLF